MLPLLVLARLVASHAEAFELEPPSWRCEDIVLDALGCDRPCTGPPSACEGEVQLACAALFPREALDELTSNP